MGNLLEASKVVEATLPEERWVVIESAATFEAPKLEERNSSDCSSPQSEQDLNLSYDSGYEEPEQNAALEQPTSELHSKVKSRGEGYSSAILF